MDGSTAAVAVVEAILVYIGRATSECVVAVDVVSSKSRNYNSQKTDLIGRGWDWIVYVCGEFPMNFHDPAIYSAVFFSAFMHRWLHSSSNLNLPHHRTPSSESSHFIIQSGLFTFCFLFICFESWSLMMIIFLWIFFLAFIFFFPGYYMNVYGYLFKSYFVFTANHMDNIEHIVTQPNRNIMSMTETEATMMDI